jgi:DNA polymerase
MTAAMWRVEHAGYDVLMTVHDEVLAEREKNCGDLIEFEELMTRLPAWGKGIPIDVESWVWDRYRKG